MAPSYRIARGGASRRLRAKPLAIGDTPSYNRGVKHEQSIAKRPRRQPDAVDFARAKAAHAIGGDIAHVVVGEWLLTWGKPGRKSFGDWLHDQDG